MIRHCIFVFSDYLSGKRVALHLESENPHFILKESKKILLQLKNKYSSIKCGIYNVNTFRKGWDEVVKYDQFFSDIEVLSKVKFFKSIKENLYLKEFEENIITNLSPENHFGSISLLARKNNLNKDLDELKNLKDLPEFRKSLEEEFEKLNAQIYTLQILLSLDNPEDNYSNFEFKNILKTTSKFEIGKILNFKLKELRLKAKDLERKEIHPIHKLFYKVKIKRLEFELLKQKFGLITKKNEQEKGIVLDNKIK